MSEVALQETRKAFQNRISRVERRLGGVTILGSNFETRASALVERGRDDWVVTEESYYEPMGFTSDEDESVPFCTTGERWYINVGQGTYFEENGDFGEEGEIQGLVYAVDAIEHGGRLEEASYYRYIQQLLVNALDDMAYVDMKPLVQDVVDKVYET